MALPMPSLESMDLAELEIEKRIVRKQDVRILPWICVTYLLREPTLLFWVTNGKHPFLRDLNHLDLCCYLTASSHNRTLHL